MEGGRDHGGLTDGDGKNSAGRISIGRKIDKKTDKRRTTKHQGAGGRNSGEKSLRSGTY